MNKHLRSDHPDGPEAEQAERPKEMGNQERSRCDDLIGSDANQALIWKANANVRAPPLESENSLSATSWPIGSLKSQHGASGALQGPVVAVVRLLPVHI